MRYDCRKAACRFLRFEESWLFEFVCLKSVVPLQVDYISTHPIMDSWRVSSVYSNMESTDRMNQIQAFIEGKVIQLRSDVLVLLLY